MENNLRTMDVMSYSKKILSYAVRVRRQLHAHPELTSQELATSQFLKEEAKKCHLEICPIPKDSKSNGLGFIAVLDTHRPGKTLALRTDMDALAIQENPCNLSGKRQVGNDKRKVTDGHSK